MLGQLFWNNLIFLGVAVSGLLTLLALLHLQERLTGRYLAHRLGWRTVLLTGGIGVPVHELSHLFFAKLFGHRIIAWKLFEPDPVSGTLGYVRHAYSQRSFWQLLGTFFIGIAPLILGGVALFFIFSWMVHPTPLTTILLPALTSEPLTQPGQLLHNIKDAGYRLALTTWDQRTLLLPLQLFLGLCIAHHIAPSRADLKGALPGFAMMLGLLLAVAWGASTWGKSLAGVIALLVPLGLIYIAVALFQGLYLTIVGISLKLLGK